jgi:hypothetical protein
VILRIDNFARSRGPASDELGTALQSLSVADAAIIDVLTVLLASKLFLPQHAAASLTPEDRARNRISLAVYQREGRTYAPAFSSIEALASFAPPGTPYAAIDSRTLFQIWSGDWLVINPASRCSLIFSPDEVHQLGAGHLPTALEIRAGDRQPT